MGRIIVFGGRDVIPSIESRQKEHSVKHNKVSARIRRRGPLEMGDGPG